jgi:hypothetical protein
MFGMQKYSTDYLISGALIGAIVTAALIVVFSFSAISSGFFATNIAKIAASAGISACLILIRPILLKTMLSSRRSPFLLKEDLDSMIFGRAVGMICGVLIGITLFVELS